jgi:hypothetical protein
MRPSSPPKADFFKSNTAQRKRAGAHVTGSSTTNRKSPRSTSASVCWVKRSGPS